MSILYYTLCKKENQEFFLYYQQRGKSTASFKSFCFRQIRKI